MSNYRLVHGDCIEQLALLPENSVDAIVTDPPYGLEFMGKEWDAPWKQGWQSGGSFSKPGIGERQTEWPSFSSTSKFGSANPTCAKCGGRARGKKRCKCEQPDWKPIGKRRNPENEGLPNDVTSSGMTKQMKAFQYWCELWARQCLRVLKPGGHLVSFGGSRTYHRMACAIEDAGFEVRDQMMWVYGSGFPKSHNISKALDRDAGIEREDKFEGAFERFAGPTGNKKCDKCGKWLVSGSPCQCPRPQDEAKSDLAKQWEGWGTALKPAHEPIVVARKPLEGTVADNIKKWGVGGINIDACRIEYENSSDKEQAHYNALGMERLKMNEGEKLGSFEGGWKKHKPTMPTGRFPANLMHDGSQEVLDLFPETKSGKMKQHIEGGNFNVFGKQYPRNVETIGDSGSAARFFYCPKASKRDRNDGCDELDAKPFQTNQPYGEEAEARAESNAKGSKNHHPTVKPTELMRYLCRLVTPVGGTVLDPFNGSGSTGKAAMLEGLKYIGIEQDAEYIKIAEARIKSVL